jgi:DNA polymerase III alpha subunit (gram-positive type)
MSKTVFILLDLETNGVNPQECDITEIAWVKAAFGNKSYRIVEARSDLIVSSGDLSDEIIGITHITSDMLKDFGKGLPASLKTLEQSMAQCDGLVAYNGLAFDFRVLSRFMTLDKPLIDPMLDINWAIEGSGILKYRAADHGVLALDAHSALGDVYTMAELVSLYDPKEMLASAKLPATEIKAMVSYTNRSLAAKAGFHWDPDRKSWIKTVRRRSSYPFPFEVYDLSQRSSATIEDESF